MRTHWLLLRIRVVVNYMVAMYVRDCLIKNETKVNEINNELLQQEPWHVVGSARLTSHKAVFVMCLLDISMLHQLPYWNGVMGYSSATPQWIKNMHFVCQLC